MAWADEIRTVGTITGPGLLDILHHSQEDILEMTVQTNIATVVQWFEGGGQGMPISGAWALAAGEKWSAPGKVVQGHLSLSISNAAIITYEIRWVMHT